MHNQILEWNKPLADYLACLDDECVKVLPSGLLSVIVPDLYPDDDNIEVWVEAIGDGVLVTDKGVTLRSYYAAQADPKHYQRLRDKALQIATQSGVSIVKGVLSKYGDSEDSAIALRDVVSVCQAIATMMHVVPG